MIIKKEKESALSGNHNELRPKKRSKESEVLIPTSIFYNRSISFLEAIVKQLRESGYRYSEIAQMTGRDQRNIWTLSDRASRKDKGLSEKERRLLEKAGSVEFPISIVQDRTISIMEIVVEYLRDSGMKNQQIAAVLNRSRKTVSTVYARVKRKRSEKISHEKEEAK